MKMLQNELWMSQKEIAEMFGIPQQTVSYYAVNYTKTNPNSCIRESAESIGDMRRKRKLYNQDIIAYIIKVSKCPVAQQMFDKMTNMLKEERTSNVNELLSIILAECRKSQIIRS